MSSCQTQATISPCLKGALSTSDSSDMILDVEGVSLLSKTPSKPESTFRRSPIVTFFYTSSLTQVLTKIGIPLRNHFLINS